MRHLSALLSLTAIASFGVMVLALGTMLFLNSRGVTAQRIKPHDAAFAELTGEVGTPIGSPQKIVILNDSAVLEQRGPEGQVLLDDEKLRATGQYPLQIKTVRFLGGIVSIVSLALAVGAWFAHRLLCRRAHNAPPKAI